ncbi:ribonuclease E [Reticulomyxa filosa]|uniref:Ribonuclease E n=1 Tax=Reticulomyxa filosa TaxID=46433 RepID=X6N3W1_RETFI|nr:ribonuclease E [Reticulomyxa filosa]|eukprot:ETO20741.1 ribonuclease E [Reticulomyxa filosa]
MTVSKQKQLTTLAITEDYLHGKNVAETEVDKTAKTRQGSVSAEKLLKAVEKSQKDSEAETSEEEEADIDLDPIDDVLDSETRAKVEKLKKSGFLEHSGGRIRYEPTGGFDMTSIRVKKKRTRRRRNKSSANESGNPNTKTNANTNTKANNNRNKDSKTKYNKKDNPIDNKESSQNELQNWWDKN